MPNKDKLSKALEEGLGQKSKVVTTEVVKADPVNDVVESELDETIEKMSGTDPKQGIMQADAAMKFLKDLPLTVVESNRSWKGNVAIKINTKGHLTLSRTEDTEAAFDSTNPDRLVRNMLYKAFTEGREINKWDVYLPEVNQAMDKADKTLSNKRLKAALKELAKTGKIEVLLNAKYGAFPSPNIVIGNKGKGSRKTTSELGADDLVF